MRIVFFTAFGPPHKGGVERSSVALGRRLVAGGHDVTIVTCNTEGAPPSEDIDGVSLVRLPALVLASGLFPVPLPGPRFVRLVAELRRNRPDIVATYTRFYVTALAGFLVARLIRRPLYHLERGSQTYVGPTAGVNAVSWLVDRTWGRMILRRADRVFAASDDVRRFVSSLCGRDAALLGPRVDTSVFRPDAALRAAWRNRLGLDDDTIAFVFCGRLVTTKGVLDLDRAFRDLRVQRTVLLYIGEGPDRGLLTGDGRVRLLGELDDDDIVGVLNACDVFVNPSHNEGLPNTVLEAGAVGLPVIATDVGGTREIITSTDEGILVRHGDVPALGVALEALLSDGRERARLGAGIRRRVLEQYAWNDEAVTTFLDAQ